MRTSSLAGLLAALAAVLALGPGAAVAAAPATGVIAQKPGKAGCAVSSGRRDGCTRARVLDRVAGIAVSADGRSLYAASPILGLALFDRDPASGALRQKPGKSGCLSDLDDSCRSAPAADAEYAVAVSPDDKNVYTAGLAGVSVFDRDPASGALVPKAGSAACFNAGVNCTFVPSIEFPDLVTVSPDGLNVYVGSFLSHTLTIFDRDPTGALQPKAGKDGCMSADGSGGRCARSGFPDVRALAVSPDGRVVYLGSSDRLDILDRIPGGALRPRPGPAGCVGDDPCTKVRAVLDASSVTLSADGRSLYVASLAGSAVGVFDRDPPTGALTQKRGLAGCISDDGTRGRCTNGKALSVLQHVVISADGLSVYAAGDRAIATFDRNPATGTLRQKRRLAGCVSDDGYRGVCANGRALREPQWLALSPDGRSLYAAVGLSNAVAIFDRR